MQICTLEQIALAFREEDIYFTRSANLHRLEFRTYERNFLSERYSFFPLQILSSTYSAAAGFKKSRSFRHGSTGGTTFGNIHQNVRLDL